MINVISDAKLALDHGGNSLLSPDIANKAVSLSTAAQNIGEMLALLLCQFGKWRQSVADCTAQQLRQPYHARSIG